MTDSRAPASDAPDLGRERAPPHDLALELPGDIAAVKQGLDAVRAYLVPYGVSERCAYDAELVFEELFTNVVRHGLGGATGRRIVIRMQVGTNDVTLEIVDDGLPFDPTAHRSLLPPPRIEDATRGAVGLRLVRSASRSFEYARRDGRNVTRVTLAR